MGFGLNQQEVRKEDEFVFSPSMRYSCRIFQFEDEWSSTDASTDSDTSDDEGERHGTPPSRTATAQSPSPTAVRTSSSSINLRKGSDGLNRSKTSG